MANKAQSCCQCGEEVFSGVKEALRNDRNGVKRARVTSMGQPMDKAWRAELILVSGNHSTVTLCSTCLDAPDLKKIWREVIAAFDEEKGWSLTPDEKIDEMKRQIFADPPLGILRSWRWKDDPK